MMKCLICKKTYSETYFPNIRNGGLEICVYCDDTEAAKKLKKASAESLEKAYQKQMEYERDESARFYEQVEKYDRW